MYASACLILLYVCVRMPHTAICVSSVGLSVQAAYVARAQAVCVRMPHTAICVSSYYFHVVSSAYVSIRRIRQHTSAYVAYVSIRQHTYYLHVVSDYVYYCSMCAAFLVLVLC
jgi:hypothetical protein